MADRGNHPNAMNILTRAARLFSRKKRPELSRHTVQHDKIDEGILKDWRERAARLGDVYDKVPPIGTENGDPEMWGDLVDDAFFSFFGFDEPRVLDQSEILGSRHINRTLADKLARSDEMLQTRPATRNKPLEASLATISAADSLRESLSKEMKEHTERAAEMSEMERNLQALEDLLESMRADNQETPEAHSAEAMRDLTAQRQNARDALAALEQQQAIKAPEIAGACQAAVKKAAAAADQAVDQVKSIPALGIGKAPGAGSTLSPDAMFDLAQRWSANQRLKQVAELIGNMLADLRTTRRTKRKRGIEEIVDIEMGNDISALLPAELVRLKHPVLRLDFMRRFHEAQLLQYERVSTEEQKKGPMIVVVDESGSMNGPRIVWAKATLLSLMMIANREKRPVAAVSFGGETQMASWTFPRNKPLDPVLVTEVAEQFFGGGTSTLTGLREAQRIMVADAPFHHADVVVITDGDDVWTDEDASIRDQLRTMGVTIHGVTVGIGPTDYLLNLAERTVSVTEFEAKTDAGRHLASSIN